MDKKMSNEDKKAIYAQEQKTLIQWFKTITEGKIRNVKALATLFVLQKKVSSVKSILTEFKDGEGHFSIHFAANRGFNDISEWILSEVPECIEYVDENGDTPLSYACMGNQLEAVKFLVSKGANINAVHRGRSPIQIACGKSDMEIIDFLLANGADIHIGQDSEVGTPLHWAVGEHRVDVARKLLEHGADVNAMNKHKITPLILAAASTDASMIKLLLEFHADPTIALDDNITPLHIAVEGKHVESVKPFLALPEAEALANSTTTQSHLKPIHFAVEGKSEELVRLLVDLTTEFKGQDAKTVMATVQKQFDAGNPAAAKEKPVTQLTHAQRRLCDKKREEGRAAFGKKQYQNAIEYFTAALAIDPNDEGLYANRSAAYLELEMFKEAVDDAKKAVELSPKWAKAHYRLGMAYFRQGLYVDAATAFYAGCELAPTNKELSNMFKQALEVGKREHEKEMKEAEEKMQH
ncbi:hypothetical protein WA556_007058 [Blastocystis sp. ATCC 50177/Nand II]